MWLGKASLGRPTGLLSSWIRGALGAAAESSDNLGGLHGDQQAAQGSELPTSLATKLISEKSGPSEERCMGSRVFHPRPPSLQLHLLAQ